MYINDFRYLQDEDGCTYDPDYIYDLETYDLPMECPYRQMVPIQDLTRMPQTPQGRPPSGPPPSFTPAEPQTQQLGAQPLAVDPGAIKPCLFRFVYIWPKRGNGFWAWLTFVGRRSVSGFRWTGRSWRYFGMDLRDIRSFQCF